MKNKSALIIGGGLGGLFTGAILSKEGLDVTVCEKNAIIGGGLQSFSRFGELFDTGMHIIGGMQEDGNVRRICEYLGILGKVHVKNVDPETIDTIYFSEDGQTYKIAQGRDRFVKTLSEQFPHQEERLKSYVNAMYKVADEVDLFYLRPSSDFFQVHSEDFLMPADGFIAKYLDDEHLRSVVAYMNPLYGGREDATPAYIHCLISVLYIDGPSRFAGGSILFAETLKECIEEHGGKVIAGDGVVSIHSEGKNITGIRTAGGKEISADYYISAIHPCSLFPLLDDVTLLPKPYRSRLNEIPNAYSAFTLNIKLRPNSFPYINHTVYYMSRYDAMWKFGEINEWPCGFLFITPPEIEQGKYSNKIIVTAPMKWDAVKTWENTSVGHRTADYVAWKEEMTERLLNCMEEIYPGFREFIQDVNSASPLTIRDFYGVKEGSMCGYSKNYKDLIFSQVPVVTKVPNLFLTGQNCNLHGFCGVALTAITTSEAILGRNTIINKINRFDDIRPYRDSEIPGAMKRIVSNPDFPSVASYTFPDNTLDELREHLLEVKTIDQFQRLMYKAVREVADKTTTSFECRGIEKLSKGTPYLFVSNHRDIMLDAAFLLISLADNGIDVPEVTFGANLMKGEMVIDIGKSNRMFRVERPGGSAREFYEASFHLSDYIRNTIIQKKRSVWIAQRNGRTKDGYDKTDQGLIRMLTLSGSKDFVDSISSLNIVPVAVSYEWESCDIRKTAELFDSLSGPYIKKEGEDLQSIICGVTQPKGRVVFSIADPISSDDLKSLAGLPASSLCRDVANLIDNRIWSNYHLFPNNYIAHDILFNNDYHSSHYTALQKEEFLDKMLRIDEIANGRTEDKLREIYLKIYAGAVENSEKA